MERKMVYMGCTSAIGYHLLSQSRNDLSYTVTIPEILQNVNGQSEDIYNFRTFNKFIDF